MVSPDRLTVQSCIPSSFHPATNLIVLRKGYQLLPGRTAPLLKQDSAEAELLHTEEGAEQGVLSS